MASQAFRDATNGTAVTRDSLLKKIVDLTGFSNNAGYKGGMDAFGNFSGQNEKVAAFHEANALKQLLGYFPGDSGGSGASWSNPFGGAGGSGGAVGGGGAGAGAPRFSNADNRFAAGLSDAETRLRSLLDNPDSIKQSAAYKFRVGQGQEALQRSLGAEGLLNSGNRLMELTKYGQDMGSQEYYAQAGRLGDLLGNYSQGYTADKNANVNLYGAQATAFNQAQANQNSLITNNQKIWSERTPVNIPGINNGYRWV
jgi:hypothetical protein